MSTLHVENLKGLSSGSNANKVIIPTGQTLEVADNIRYDDVPIGSVIQVFTAHGSDQTQASPTTSWVDVSNASVNITPKKIGNKILVSGVMRLGTASNPNGGFRIFRRETSGGANAASVGATGSGDGTYSRQGAFINYDDYHDNNYTIADISWQLEDTAPSLNQLTYTLQFAGGSGTLYLNRAQAGSSYGRGTYNITVMEIAQ